MDIKDALEYRCRLSHHIKEEWLTGKPWPIEFFETLKEIKNIAEPANMYGGRQPYDVDGHISFLMINDQEESDFTGVTMMSAIKCKEIGSPKSSDVISYVCDNCFTHKENVFQL